jgi:hypothetical protein
MRVATRMHFLALYRDKGLFTEQDAIDGADISHEDRKYVDGYSKFFCDLACHDPDLIQYATSVAAAAGVAASRDLAGIRPVWPEALEESLGFREEELAACYSKMCVSFARDFDEEPGKRADFGSALSPHPACRLVIQTPPPLLHGAVLETPSGGAHARPQTGSPPLLTGASAAGVTCVGVEESAASLSAAATPRAMKVPEAGSPINIELAGEQWA